jgi:cytochrome c oxidase subunit 2
MDAGASTSEAASVLAPAGVEAALLREMSGVLVAGAGAVFLLVTALTFWALRRRGRPVPGTAWWVVGGGIAWPVLTLTALLVYAGLRTTELQRAPVREPLVVAVTGRLWWWEVRYQDGSGRDVRLANELRLPVGRPVRIGLQSADVIHSFWVPALGGKVDLVPGRVNQLLVTPTQPGLQRGQCAEYCGQQHARMALHVVLVPGEQFEAWLQQQAAPAVPVPGTAGDALGGDEVNRLARGRRAFETQGCAACHSVRGVSDGARLGPDLTHVASRHALGAGVLPNGPGAARRWLTDVQQLKPGARMPSYAHLDAATLDALGAWLESLR